MTNKRAAIFTICSNNYLASARTFFDSVRRNHPDGDLFLCLADRLLEIDGFYDPDWKVVEADKLAIPDFAGFSFRYDIMEFNTALKPFMFQHLLELGYEIVLYFDPDIEVFRSLDDIVSKLSLGASFFLTPHLCSPSEDQREPNDITIMMAGIYNLGFLGVSRGEESRRIIAWWARRLRYQCINSQSEGIFVDQKFMDLVPGFAPNAHISHDTTLNVAYWNLPQRHLLERDGGWFVDGRPLTFYHYSGFDPNRPEILSKHDRRFNGTMPEPLRHLTEAYTKALLKNGYGTLSGVPYAYDRFASGTTINHFIRQMFRQWHRIWLDDPFFTYEAYLHEPWPGASRRRRGYIVTNFMKFLYDAFPYLRTRLDLTNPDHVVELVNWYVRHSPEDLKLDLPLVEPEAARLGALKHLTAVVPPNHLSGQDVTIIGYLRTASGVGEVGRQTLRTLVAGGLKVEGYDVAIGVASARNDKSCDGFLVERGNAPVQIFNVNADQLPIVIETTHSHLSQPALKISIPFWELGLYPDEWLPAFSLVDEIWAPSRFIQRSLAGRVECPVIYMPIAIELAPSTPLPRARFGLPEDRFLFFYAFDFLSFMERKNPSAAIAAFRLAFPHYGDAALVIKSMNGALMPEKLDALQQEIGGHPDIILLDETLSRADTLDLIATMDAILSLHRSEGFGLLLAEAMLLCKPVIATGYSASRELVTEETGYPVGYELVPVQDGEYPFPAGQRWAAPDISHAAWIMRRLRNEPSRAAQRVFNGQEYIRHHHGRASVGKLQVSRMRILGGR
jgi:glycosyltransferase involved in cell wall biosynthesis